MKVYTQIQPDVLRAVVTEAHRRGMTVTGHVPAAVTTEQGVEDGMDQINHLQFVTRAMIPEGAKGPFTEADLQTERAKKLIALLAEKHIVVDPTIGCIATASFEPGVEAAPFPLQWRYENIGVAGMDAAKFHERMAANEKVIGALFHAGVPIVAGSDTNLMGYGLDRELELYVQSGMTPLEAIQTATIGAAKAMRRDGELGTIEVGKRADLVLVRGNPLADIHNLRQVVSVVTDGRMYDSKALGRTVGFHR
jgi:imidazolonepropionase-like amidohydrolase